MRFSLIPFQEFTIVSYKPKQDVIQLLRDNIETRDNAPTLIEALTGTPDVPFYGRISGDRFNVLRKTSFRNEFRPELEGQIRDNGYKTFIDVKAQTKRLILVLVAVVGV